MEKMKAFQNGWLLAAVTLLGACATLPQQTAPRTFNVGGIELLSKSAEQQIVLFQTPEDVEKFCLAPPPDAVPTFGEGVSIGVHGSGGGETVSDGAAVLGGRGPGALIARELLYRTCEFSLNYKLDKQEALKLYRETLRSVERISRTKRGGGSAALEGTASIHVPSANSQDNNNSDSD